MSEEYMRILAWTQSIPSFYWIPITFVALLLFILIIIGITYLHNYFRKPVLVVNYDNGKYNDIEEVEMNGSGTKYYIPMLACRIKVCNNSNKCISDVEILIEVTELATPFRGYFTKFNDTQTKVYNCDIYPKSCEIVTLCHFAKNFNEEDRLIELIIKCRGKVTPEVTKMIILNNYI